MTLLSDPSIPPAPFVTLHAKYLQQYLVFVSHATVICSPLIAIICLCQQRYYYIQITSKNLYSLLIRLLFNSKHFEKSIDSVSHDVTSRAPIPEARLLVSIVNIICRTSITVHRLVCQRDATIICRIFQNVSRLC